MGRLSEQYAIIGMLEPADNQAGSLDSESINMGLLHRVALVFQHGAITGDNAAIIVYSGASAGTKTTAMIFKYRLGGGVFKAANNDVFGDATAITVAATGLVMAAATYKNKVLVIEVDSQDMADGEPWLTIDYDDGSASVLLSNCIAIGVPRTQMNDVGTVV